MGLVANPGSSNRASPRRKPAAADRSVPARFAALARHKKLHFLFNFRDRDRIKLSFTQFLIQLGQLRLFERCPLRDTLFGALAGLLVESNRLGRHSTIPAFDNTQG